MKTYLPPKKTWSFLLGKKDCGGTSAAVVFNSKVTVTFCSPVLCTIPLTCALPFHDRTSPIKNHCKKT